MCVYLQFFWSPNILLLKLKNPSTHMHAHPHTHSLPPMPFLSPVTSNLFESLPIKMTVVKLSARLSFTAAVIGADRLNICLEQSTGGSPSHPRPRLTTQQDGLCSRRGRGEVAHVKFEPRSSLPCPSAGQRTHKDPMEFTQNQTQTCG